MFDVVTFGSATRDVFVKSQNFKTFQDREFLTGRGICFSLGSKVYLDKMSFATGGGGTNVAATFARQGLRTAYVGRIGQDPGGRVIKEELKKLKIKTFLTEDLKHQTNYSIILSASAKGRTILTYNGASYFTKTKDIPFNKLRSGWFYLSGLAGQSAKTLIPIINFAKKKRIKVALNPGKAQIALGLKGLKKVLSVADVLSLNQEEASILTKIPYQKEKEIFRKLDKFVAGIVVMTKGPKGVVVSNGKEIFKAGIFKEKKYIDRTGAGDAFGSGFVSAYIRTGDIPTAIRMGSANSTSMVEHFGAKNGILSQGDFKAKRWQSLTIKKEKL